MAVNRSVTRQPTFSGQALIPLGRTTSGDEMRLPDAAPLNAPRQSQASHLEDILGLDSVDDRVLEWARIVLGQGGSTNNRTLVNYAERILDYMEHARLGNNFREAKQRAKLDAGIEVMREVVSSLDLADRNSRMIFGA